MHDQTAEESLAVTLRAMRGLNSNQDALDAATARNILHEDLGYFKGTPTTYSFNDDVRDRLLAHARQDAAHAVISSISAGKRIRNLERSTSILMVMVAVLLASQLWAVFQ